MRETAVDEDANSGLAVFVLLHWLQTCLRAFVCVSVGRVDLLIDTARPTGWIKQSLDGLSRVCCASAVWACTSTQLQLNYVRPWCLRRVLANVVLAEVLPKSHKQVTLCVCLCVLQYLLVELTGKLITRQRQLSEVLLVRVCGCVSGQQSVAQVVNAAYCTRACCLQINLFYQTTHTSSQADRQVLRHFFIWFKKIASPSLLSIKVAHYHQVIMDNWPTTCLFGEKCASVHGHFMRMVTRKKRERKVLRWTNRLQQRRPKGAT